MSELQTYQSEVLLPSDPRGGARAGAGRRPGIAETRPRKQPAGADEVLRVLTSAEEKNKWRALVVAAEDNPKLMLEVLTRISELRRGKPFAAVNPRAQRAPAADNQLLVAIQNIMPSNRRTSKIIDAPKAKRKGKR